MLNDQDEKTAFDLACRYLLQDHPAAVGVVYVALDCRCVKMGRIDAKGNIRNPLTLILNPASRGSQGLPRCSACESDRGLDLSRMVRHGLVWPKRETDFNDEERRRVIGRRIFGPAYPKNSSDLILSGPEPLARSAELSKSGSDSNPMPSAR